MQAFAHFLRHDAILCSILATFGSGATHKGLCLCCVAALGMTAGHFATLLITFTEKAKPLTHFHPPFALFAFSVYICAIIQHYIQQLRFRETLIYYTFQTITRIPMKKLYSEQPCCLHWPRLCQWTLKSKCASHSTALAARQ